MPQPVFAAASADHAVELLDLLGWRRSATSYGVEYCPLGGTQRECVGGLDDGLPCVPAVSSERCAEKQLAAHDLVNRDMGVRAHAASAALTAVTSSCSSSACSVTSLASDRCLAISLSDGLTSLGVRVMPVVSSNRRKLLVNVA